MKRSIEEILADKQLAAEAYAEAVQTKPAHEVVPFAQKVTDLVKEIDTTISEGADACKCGAKPMGMIKTPSYINKDGLEQPTVYEVGCVVCPPVLVEHENGDLINFNGEQVNVKRRSVSARGYSPEQAVERWNTGLHVEDNYLHRIPGFSPDFVDLSKVASSPGPVVFRNAPAEASE